MRKLGVIFLMFFGGNVFSQQRVIGPEAKNTNVWDVKKRLPF